MMIATDSIHAPPHDRVSVQHAFRDVKHKAGRRGDAVSDHRMPQSTLNLAMSIVPKLGPAYRREDEYWRAENLYAAEMKA